MNLRASFFSSHSAQQGMAVYTHLTHEQISNLLADYSIGELVSAQPIMAGIDNSNYLLTTTENQYILTLYEKRINPQDLPFYLQLISYMKERGIACPRTVPRKDGKLISKVMARDIAITSFLNGKSLNDIKPIHLHEVGELSANMHKASKEFPLRLENALAPDKLAPLYNKVKDRLDEFGQGLSAAIGEELERMRQWPALNLPRGVVHADIFPDNVFFIGDKLTGIIDFYFACEEYLAYDLAITFNAWCFDGTDNAEFNFDKAQALISSYNQRRPLNESELEMLPFLARSAAMRYMLTRACDWFFQIEGAVVKPHDPAEYVKKWQFHCQPQRFKDYIQ